jgi:hypothetical protein
MKITGREFIDELEKNAALEWYRYPRSEIEVGGSASAVVVWRFDTNQTSNERIIQINAVIRSALDTVTNFEWDLKYTGRNWMLAPVKFLKLEESGRFRNDGEVRSYIAQEEPDFFTKAHADLLEIANAVAYFIQK